nr:hypothetical protein [Tanacetum cinerariifolium]
PRVAGLCWGEWGVVVGSSGLWWNGAGSGEMEVTGVAGKLGMYSSFKSQGEDKVSVWDFYNIGPWC